MIAGQRVFFCSQDTHGTISVEQAYVRRLFTFADLPAEAAERLEIPDDYLPFWTGYSRGGGSPENISCIGCGTLPFHVSVRRSLSLTCTCSPFLLHLRCLLVEYLCSC